ncbi:serine/threonine-protein kinase [Anaeromicropila herbilytica]|uniref:Protein kinase domain-containing protein n=1 Tax=Anaeromicropila herbilytica TaxID=2785025 RepID=A0A7R7IF81_9FIRM|nr:serine/threonine-protein kinase [Anaeromicropila herbilytica]BCN32826.1 hypothetical protein bsdtb5_41210 [Anaeromicropila herbilytica]
MISKIWFNKYEVIDTLGKGGNATVYLVKHIRLQSYRAIKRIDKENKLYSQIINEANILKNIRHNNIPIIYDIEEDDKYSYIIEEYMEGITLKEFRQQYQILDEEIILKYAIQVCELVEYLHTFERKILYLDLKPDNIIISDEILKLVDFGSAIYYADLNKRRYATGTRGYASPEQYSSNFIDERSDIYGIGMLMFYMITGVSFNKNINSIVNIDEIHSCSDNLKSIINKCLKLYPAQRFHNVHELKEKLLECSHSNNSNSLIKSNKTLSIAIAGSQCRIGVTHISILLTTYLGKFIGKSLYSERNNTQTVNKIVSRYCNVKRCDYIYRVNNIEMLPNYNQTVIFDKDSYSYEIKDFGVLTEENKESFLKSDYKCLILGSKDWELEHSENALSMLSENENITYLFNYTDGKTYQSVMKSMKNLTGYRIPYEPNPFMINNQKIWENFVFEIFHVKSNRNFARILGKI